MTILTAQEVLDTVLKRARWMREEGESDIRSIIWLCNGLKTDIDAGKTREDILSELQEDEEE